MQNEWTFDVLINLRVFARELSTMTLLARGVLTLSGAS